MVDDMSSIQSTKSEARNKIELRKKTYSKQRACSFSSVLNLFRISTFGFRIYLITMTIKPNRGRFLLIALAGISLLSGVWAGIARMGWLLPVPNEKMVLVHGPLMVVGFLGTLIGLERAVALQRWWAYAIPICAGAGALLALTGAPVQVSASLAVLAGILLIAVFVTLYRQYPSEHFVIRRSALSPGPWAICCGLPRPRSMPWSHGGSAILSS